MIPLALRITNFKSFRESQHFSFPRKPGLYFMQGVNALEPRLDANGTGKSTLWEALTWCWYGKTSKGLKAGDVCNWDEEKGAAVEFEFELANGYAPFILRRTWSPISWTLAELHDGTTHDLIKEKDNPALSWLALEFEPWLNAILMAQSEPMFLDMKREPQATLFSSVMGLDRWIEYSQRAGKAAADTDQKLRRLERDLAAARGELEGIGKQDFGQSIAQWENERKRKADRIIEEYQEKVEKRAGLKRAVQDAEAEEAQAREQVRAEREKIERAAKPAAGEKRCPECGSVIRDREEHVTNDRYHILLDVVEVSSRTSAGARRALELLDRGLDELEREMDRLASEKNPYADLARSAKERAESLFATTQFLKLDIEDAQERGGLQQFWVKGFKEVRLSLIAEALTELEIEVNSSCDALGLVGWELQFQVDKETKGGSVQRGFNCYVRSPHNDRQVPWEAWSGGEAQRLRAAAQMGLSNLIRSRTGTPLALEVWDEPTAGLSPQGIRDLLDCLHERAEREQRVIWIVDHRTHEYGGFAGGATITKGPKGSVITTSY